jgi:hypothetical protein
MAPAALRPTLVVVVLALLGGSLAGPGATGVAGATEAPTACPAPRALLEATWPFGAAVPAGVDGPTATHGSYEPVPPAATHAGPDTDGDGQPDEIEFIGDTMVITRGSGTVTLQGPSWSWPSTRWANAANRAADLDGDGRDELWTDVTAVNGNPAPWNAGIWILPGDLPDGTYQEQEVAVPFYATSVVGDLTGDGRNDLQVPGPPTGFKVFNKVRYASVEDLTTATPGEIEEMSTDIAAGRTDIDGDGELDTVFHADHTSAGGLASVHLSATGSVLPLGDRALRASTWVTTTDTRSFVVFGFAYPSVIPPTPDQHAASFQIQLRCAAPWTAKTTELLLGRAPGPGERAIVPDDSDPSPTLRRWFVAVGLVSAEGRTKAVHDRFRWLLGRSADPSALRYWVAALTERRRTTEHLTASALGSSERFRRSGGTTSAWVDGLYRDLVGRASDPSGRAYWVRQAATVGRERAAARFLASTSVRRARVAATYQAVLQRSPTIAECDAGVALIAAGGEDSLLQTVASSDESYLAGR